MKGPGPGCASGIEVVGRSGIAGRRVVALRAGRRRWDASSMWNTKEGGRARFAEESHGNERGGGLQSTSLAEEPATHHRDRCRRVRRARRPKRSAREMPNAASPQRSRGSLRYAFSWYRRRRALPRTRLGRSLPGQTIQARRRGALNHVPLFSRWRSSVMRSIAHEEASETSAARTVLQPLRAGPIIRAGRLDELLPDAGAARRTAGTNGR